MGLSTLFTELIIATTIHHCMCGLIAIPGGQDQSSDGRTRLSTNTRLKEGYIIEDFIYLNKPEVQLKPARSKGVNELILQVKGMQGSIGRHEEECTEGPTTVTVTCDGNSCGGVMISQNLIATAAHCIFSNPGMYGDKKDIPCRKSCDVRISGEKKYTISSRIYHANYIENVEPPIEGLISFDIAMFKLESSITSSVSICPMKKSSDSYCEDNHPDNCTVYKGNEKVEVRLPNLKDCMSEIEERIYCKRAHILCVKSDERFVKGDSGSPIVCTDRNGKKFLTAVLHVMARDRVYATPINDYMLEAITGSCPPA